jgi:hypothetical protein
MRVVERVRQHVGTRIVFIHHSNKRTSIGSSTSNGNACRGASASTCWHKDCFYSMYKHRCCGVLLLFLLSNTINQENRECSLQPAMAVLSVANDRPYYWEATRRWWNPITFATTPRVQREQGAATSTPVDPNKSRIVTAVTQNHAD